MLLVDSNIVAYLLLQGDRTKEAQELFSRDPDWRSEGFLVVELTNILATYARAGHLTLRQAEMILAEGLRIMDPGFVTVPDREALRVACQMGVSAYDARFLVVAEALDLRLITEDRRLRQAVPGLTISLKEALA